MELPMTPPPMTSTSTCSAGWDILAVSAFMTLTLLTLKVLQVGELGFPHLVKQRAYLGGRADGGCEWIEHQRIACGLFFAIEQRITHQGMYRHVRAIQPGQLFRQGPKVTWL